MKRTVKGYLLFSILGFLWMFFGITEQKLAKDGNIVWTFGWTGRLTCFSLILGILSGSLVYFVMTAVSQWSEKRQSTDEEKGRSTDQAAGRGRLLQEKLPEGKLLSGGGFFGDKAGWRKWFLISWLCIFLCWLPGYLAYYPAICSYDMTIQLGQIREHAFNDHHPIFHTLLIKGAMVLGEWLGDVNTGIGLYAFLQLLLLAAALAAGIALLHRKGIKKGWLIILLLYACILPFHMYMSISVTKDTIFSVFFLLQLLLLAVVLKKGSKEWKPQAADWGYMGCTVGMILFRSNGKYALLVLLGFLVLAAVFGKKLRKLYVRLLVQSLISLIVGNILLNGIYGLTDAQQGDRREMLSIPIQQLARTMVYHGGAGVAEEDDNTMSEQDKALINDFILDQAYREYRPDIADPVKRHTNTYVARYRTKEFLTTYLGLFLEYPGDYINAVLAVNAGYLYPGDVSHAVINVNGRDRGLGYIQTRWVENELNPDGIYKDSKWEGLHEVLEEFADSNGYLKIPVLKYLMVPGSYLWLYLVLAAWLMLKKRYRLLLVLSLVLGYYLTLFLGPAVQLRYLYPVMIALPYLAMWSADEDGKSSKCRSCRFTAPGL